MRTELSITRLSKLGEGVASLGGRTVFVEGALPGERVVAEVEPSGKVLRGRLIAVVEASPARRDPACPLSAECGGCDWLHAQESLQREAKQEIVLSTLEHLGGFSRAQLGVPEVVVSPRALGYRRRAVLHFSRGKLSFFGRRSHASVAVEHCPALAAPLESLPGKLGPLLSPMAKDVEEVRLLAEGAQAAFAVVLKGPVKERHLALCQAAVRQLALEGAVLVPPSGSIQLVGRPVLRALSPLVPEAPLYLRPDVFAQANAEANVALVAAAVQGLGAGESDEVLELYAGSGNFTFALAGTARGVVAVESAAAAIELAQRTAREAGAANVRFIQGDVTKVCEGLVREGRRFDLLLADPPRSGAPRLRDLAVGLGVRRVVYVACDPASLARDAAGLASAGFHPRRLQIVDMFPQTRHVEVVMTLSREH